LATSGGNVAMQTANNWWFQLQALVSYLYFIVIRAIKYAIFELGA